MGAWLTMLAFACHDGNSGRDDSASVGGEGDADTDTDSDSDTDSELPTITSADAACAHHTTGTQYWLWTLDASADDPQGVKTIDPIGDVDVIDIATTKLAAHYALACSPKGVCVTGFNESADDILCKDPTAWRFLFTVTDEDKNVSKPYEVIGRLAGD